MIKSIIQGETPRLLSFPILMKSKASELVVLFQSDSLGTVVNPSGSVYKIGCHSDDWDLSSFEKFTGVVTLSND